VLVGALPLILLSMAACAPKPPAPPSPSPVGRAAVETCRAGLAAAADRPAREQLDAYAASCSGLYLHPACRAAVAGIMRVPVEGRVAHVVYTCRDAYCPTLAPPLPELCGAPDPNPSEMATLWPPLQARILSEDLGLTTAQSKALLAGISQLQPTSWTFSVPPAAAAAGPTIAIAPVEGALLVTVGAHRFEVPAEESAAAFAERLRPLLAGHEGESIVIAADVRTDFRSVRVLIEALNALGFTKLKFWSTAAP
jgi:hypothetical protein